MSGLVIVIIGILLWITASVLSNYPILTDHELVEAQGRLQAAEAAYGADPDSLVNYDALLHAKSDVAYAERTAPDRRKRGWALFFVAAGLLIVTGFIVMVACEVAGNRVSRDCAARVPNRREEHLLHAVARAAGKASRAAECTGKDLKAAFREGRNGTSD